MPTIRRAVSVAALVAAFALGWVLHPGTPPVASPAPSLNSIPARIVYDLVSRLNAQDQAVTAESRRLLALAKVYRDSLQRFSLRPGRDTVWIREATTPRDSAARCSVVLVDCSRRAELAEHRADALQKQLEAQVGLQPHRWAITLGAGPTYVLWPKRAWGMGANVSLSLRLW